MLRLQDRPLKHRHRINRPPTALGAAAVAQAVDKSGTGILEIKRRIENFKPIALLAQHGQMIRKVEKITRVHDYTSMSAVNHISAQFARLTRVSSSKLSSTCMSKTSAYAMPTSNPARPNWAARSSAQIDLTTKTSASYSAILKM